jgi:hypothetical protein
MSRKRKTDEESDSLEEPYGRLSPPSLLAEILGRSGIPITREGK